MTSAGTATHVEVIAGTPQQCFDAITDYDTFPDWQRAIVACEVRERDADGRGTLVATTLDVKVRKIRYVLRYSYEEPERIRWDYVEGDAKDISGGYEFEDLGDGTTKASYTVAVKIGQWVPGPVKRFVETQAIATSVRELKDRVENGA